MPHRLRRSTTASLVLFDRGDEVVVQGGENGIRFLLVSGQPLQEPVAWYGPIVMNTQAELRQAFDELEQGTFLKQDQRGLDGEPRHVVIRATLRAPYLSDAAASRARPELLVPTEAEVTSGEVQSCLTHGVVARCAGW